MRRSADTGSSGKPGYGGESRGNGAASAPVARGGMRAMLRRGAACGAILFSVSVLGCNGDSRVKEFRERATPGIQAGVEQMISGLLDGVFAVSDPDTTSGE